MAAEGRCEMAKIKQHTVYILYSNEHHVYIGITKQPEIRKSQHLTGKGSKLIYELLLKGYLFEFEILQSKLTELEASSLEEDLIIQYTKDKYCVLNRTSGGQLGSIGQIGERHHNTKLKDNEVKLLRTMYYENLFSQSDLANEFNISITTVNNLITGKIRIEAGGPISINNLAKCVNRKLSKEDIYDLRIKYSKVLTKVNFTHEAKLYNISGAHLSRLLRGVSGSDIEGPILGKDYIW
jgi:predicted GIY-YIG superfamily endonuclease